MPPDQIQSVAGLRVEGGDSSDITTTDSLCT